LKVDAAHGVQRAVRCGQIDPQVFDVEQQAHGSLLVE
jgi:hypothetical protein